MGNLKDRIDRKKLEELKREDIPSPIHAVNYVEFRNARYYRLYGLLLAPYAIPKGARPVWAGLHEDDIVGKENDDEIVILEYPNHNSLIDIFTSKYYESINGLREKGIKKLGFAFCKKQRGVRKIGKGSHLVVRFNHQSSDEMETRQLFEQNAEKHCKIEYLAREMGRLDIFKEPVETDPAEVNFKNIGILSNDMIDGGIISEFEAKMRNNGFGMTVQRFRTLGISESMPWSKRFEVCEKHGRCNL